MPGQQSEDLGARHLDVDNDSESEKKESGPGCESERSHGHGGDHGGEGRNQDRDDIITGDKDREKKDSDIDKNICEGDKSTATATVAATATATAVEHCASRDDDDDDGGVAKQDSGGAKEEKCNIKSSEGNQGKEQGGATEEEMTSPVKQKDHGALVSDAKSHGGVNVAEETAVTNRVDESESEGSHANANHVKEARVDGVSAGKDAHADVSESVSSDLLQETQNQKHVSESESEAAKKPDDHVNKDIGDRSGTDKDSELGQDVAALTPQKRPYAAMHAADVITGTA
jgi:hypothetical protein